jgi:hypothetical protein
MVLSQRLAVKLAGWVFWKIILTTNFCPEASKVSLRLSLTVGLCQETLGSRLMFFYRLHDGWPWPLEESLTS